MATDPLPPPSLEECPFCGTAYDLGDLPLTGVRLSESSRLAFDPEKGRLWAVCGTCRRWTAFPLEMRWEVLEACERAVRGRGSVRLRSENLSLVSVEEGEMVRVGRPLRVEFAGWRYGDHMPPPDQRRGFWARLFASFLNLPDPPPEGYDPYGTRSFTNESLRKAWFASPFLEHSARLTHAFAQVPLAPECPACGGPVLLLPWDFQNLRWERHRRTPGVMARCAACETEVFLPDAAARPALRLGLALVTPEPRARPVAEAAAEGVEQVGGRKGFVDTLVRDRREVGDLDLPERVALAMVLDEEAELEALEAEWRRAEEITAIMDGELTRVPGFEDFRRRVLEEGG